VNPVARSCTLPPPVPPLDLESGLQRSLENTCGIGTLSRRSGGGARVTDVCP